jgi:hypothetical protein
MQEKLIVAEVNCDDHKILCKMQGIQGYPTIFLYVNFSISENFQRISHSYQHGRTHEYTGRRTLEALGAFVDAALAPYESCFI